MHRHQHTSRVAIYNVFKLQLHKVLLSDKHEHQQNKLSRHVRAIGETGSGKYKPSSVNKHSAKGHKLVGGFTMEALHVIY